MKRKVACNKDENLTEAKVKQKWKSRRDSEIRSNTKRIPLTDSKTHDEKNY